MTTSINYMKLIMSIGMIVFAAALVIGGTGAFFSDTETSEGNVFAAGAIDLLIDNTSYGFDYNDPTVTDPSGEWGLNQSNSWTANNLTDQLFFYFGDLKPGDYGEDTISIRVDDNDAWACMAFDLTGTPENGLTDPEGDVDTTAGTDEGELQNYLSFLFWYDDGDNVYEVGEKLIEGLNGPSGSIFNGGWLPIADSENGPALPGTETVYVGKGWCFGDMVATPVERDLAVNTPPAPGATGFTCDGSGDNNDAQTDGITVDVSFYAVQSRNNDQFVCSSLPRLEGVVGTQVGATAFAYAAPVPGACTVTVDKTGNADYTTLTQAEANAAEGQTICVGTGTYVEDVTVDVPNLTILGLNDPTGVSKATLDGRMNINSDGVTVRGLEFTNPDAGYGIVINGVDSTEISFNSFSTIGTAILGSAQAIYYDGGVSAASGLSIHGNVIDGVGNVGSTASTKGIFIGDSTSPAPLSGVVIKNNLIRNIVTTRGAYGVLINYGVGSTGSVPGAIVSNNTIDDLSGLWAHAVGLETDTAGALVTLNDISNVVGTSGDSQGVFFEGNPNSDVAVNFNNFAPGVTFGVGIHPSNSAILVDAEDNWWGDVDPSDNVFESSGTIDYVPFQLVSYPTN